ncbi:uncharacterized protein LTR77_007180 [Saxophila tyrrhenica]|uniref:Peroxisomal membrane protein 11C n=1 Tax=Saxophila tyrrhenica TaxID=1690608 RepID=A0AAV9P5X4_9PEZI|nr:hypothetical protein LTR77_007180 [Saxophila tyrrhenica]
MSVSRSSSNIRLSLLLARIDALLLHTSRLLSTSSGIESTLSTIFFTSTIAHVSIYQFLLDRHKRLAKQAARQPTFLEARAAFSAALPAPKLSRTCVALRVLARTSGESWMFLRLLGLFHVYRWAHDIWEKPHRDPAIKVLLWVEVGMAACAQAMENVVYLALKGILPGKRKAAKWMVVSDRLWTAQVVLEMLKLARVWQMGWREELGAEKRDDEVGVEEEDVGYCGLDAYGP